MSVAVVHLLEVVEVGEDEGKRAAEALGAADLAGETLLEVTPVGEVGEAVRAGLTLDEAVKANVLECDGGLRAEPECQLARLVAEVCSLRREEEHRVLAGLRDRAG